jgi:trehalose-phosphatase
VTDAQTAARQAGALLDGGRTLLVSDFDGTLADLVGDPWAATIVPAARRALRRLAARDDMEVVLLSGRTALDLAFRVRVGGVGYLGDHGSQRAMARRGFRLQALHVEHEPLDPRLSALVRLVTAEIPRAVPEPWLVVEGKHAAVTLHFRTAPDVDAARSRVLAASDAIDPAGLLVRSGGRRSVELRPPGATDKGAAMRRLLEERRPGVVIALGDDHTDVLAFEALREARAAHRVRGLSVGVASRPEVSALVAPSTDLMLGSAADAARFLALLARERPPGARTTASGPVPPPPSIRARPA